MSATIRLITIIIMTMAVGLLTGCGKEDTATTQVSAASAVQAGNWTTALPPKFAGLALKDGGNCSLDTVNGALAGTGAIPIKSGASVSMVGWEVANLQADVVGTSFGIQLNGAASYSIPADSFVRPGLGAALKKPGLDGGGLKLDSTILNVPAGDYRVLFLARSDDQLLRCDTGRTVHIE